MKQIIFVAVATLTACSASHVQPPEEPFPIKMGLWEVTSVITASGGPKDQTAGSKEQTVKAQMCLTPDTWRKVIASEEDKECQKTNFKQDASGMSFDFECVRQNGNKGTGYVRNTFVSQEKMHQVAHADGTMDTQVISMDAIADYFYLDADCKGIAPGSSSAIPNDQSDRNEKALPHGDSS
jgi:hypothetical protein